MLKKILLGLLLVLVIAQFFQPALNNGTADSIDDIAHVVAVPDSVHGLLKTACYDCHSNHTSYPWYSRITPVNWWLKNHVEEGKKHLNFTSFAKYSEQRKAKKLEEIRETVENGEMPLPSYLWIHHEAKLNESQKQLLIEWAKSSHQKTGFRASSN